MKPEDIGELKELIETLTTQQFNCRKKPVLGKSLKLAVYYLNKLRKHHLSDKSDGILVTMNKEQWLLYNEFLKTKTKQ
jgi:hypothetical protein